jgi:ubiquinone/menaquinone biosynthesis C-methylase UbiE
MILQKIENVFWDLYATSYSNLAKSYLPYIRLKTEVISKMMANRKRENEIIFDCGCGTGDYFNELAANDFKVLGLDLSATMLKHARKKQQNGILMMGNLNENIPLADNSVDQVLSVNNFYILGKPVHVVQEWYRILKPGGFLNLINLTRPLNLIEMNKAYFSTYGFREYIKMLQSQFINGVCNIYIQAQMKHGAYNYFSNEDHTNLLKDAGFSIEFINNTYICNYDVHIVARKKFLN